MAGTMRFYAVMAMGLAATSSQAAPLPLDVQRCLSVFSEPQRLECYDAAAVAAMAATPDFVPPPLMPPALYRRPGAPPAEPQPVAPPPSMGDWRLASGEDSFDDAAITAATLAATQTTLSPQRRPVVTSKRAIMTASCSKGRVALYVAIDGELVSSHDARVDYRLDDKPAVAGQRWSSSEDSTAVGLWSTAPALALMKQISGAQRFRIRSRHSVFGTMEADFDVRGAPVALAQVQEACSVKGRGSSGARGR